MIMASKLANSIASMYLHLGIYIEKITTFTICTHINLMVIFPAFLPGLEVCKSSACSRAITYPVFLSSPLYQTVVMSDMLW